MKYTRNHYYYYENISRGLLLRHGTEIAHKEKVELETGGTLTLGRFLELATELTANQNITWTTFLATPLFYFVESLSQIFTSVRNIFFFWPEIFQV